MASAGVSRCGESRDFKGICDGCKFSSTGELWPYCAVKRVSCACELCSAQSANQLRKKTRPEKKKRYCVQALKGDPLTCPDALSVYARGKLTFSQRCCSCPGFVIISEPAGRVCSKTFCKLVSSPNLSVCKLKSASLSSNLCYQILLKCWL